MLAPLIQTTQRGEDIPGQGIIAPLGMITGAIRTSPFTVTTTAQAIPATALINRVVLDVFNNGTEDIFVGASDVSTTNGTVIPPGTSRTFNMTDGVDLFALVATGPLNARVFEGAA